MALKVNGEVIPDSAIDYELDRLVKFYSQHMAPDQIRGQMEALRQKAIQQTVGTKLLMQEARKLDFVVPDADVEAGLKEMIAKAGGRKRFDAMLEQQGLNESMVKESIRMGRKVDALVERITQGIPDPSEQEMRAHFEKHADEYARPERSEARHILLKPASDKAADREATRAQLLQIRAQIVEGKAFADLAAAHSECPSGKRSGGSLGWFSRGMMIPEFDEAVFAMKPNELSQIVETSFGMHLIQKTGHEAGGAVAFEEISDKVRDFLRHVARGEAISRYVTELQAKAVIEEV